MSCLFKAGSEGYPDVRSVKMAILQARNERKDQLNEKVRRHGVTAVASTTLKDPFGCPEEDHIIPDAHDITVLFLHSSKKEWGN